MIAREIGTDPVDVRVERILPFGLLVRLSDGTPGLIREREIAWDTWSLRHWRKRIRIDAHLRAMPLGEGLDDRLELSLRLAERDPWEHIDARYPVGKLVTGTVSGMQPYGVFVELEPGLTGLLHRTRLPAGFEQCHPADLFWRGDTVRVVIERIDPRDRHISLCLNRALHMRWQSSIPLPTDEPYAPIVETDDATLPPTDAVALPAWRILVVEDDPTQRAALTNWMAQQGLCYVEVESAEAALNCIQHEQIDLVLTDIGLPGISGIELVQRLQSERYQSRYALMTDWSRASNYLDQIEQLQNDGAVVLLKPLRPIDLIDLLMERFARAVEPGNAKSVDPAPLAIQPESTPVVSLPWQQNLGKLLRQLHESIDATDLILFELEIGQRRVSIVTHVGSSTLMPETLLDLIHSPVRDVAEDRASCQIEDTNSAESRIRYLKPLLPFRSCLGVHIPVPLVHRYALFVFSKRPQTFGTYQIEQVTSAVLPIAILLEHGQFQRNTSDIQRLALLGQLSRALVHEMNHHLSPINFTTHDIHHQLLRLSENKPNQLDELRATFSDLLLGIEHLTNLSKTFSQLTVQSSEQVVDLRTAISDVVYLLRDASDRAHIHLLLTAPDDLPLVRLNVLQFQQMVLNVALNAIQQLAELRPTSGGCVHLRIEYQAASQRIQIQIEDDGPGIHRQLWERIYELGFTTRQIGGSGLGLYITRGLAEAMGGRIAIVESHRLWGTTFMLELPARLM